MGALISYTLITYICQYGIPELGGEKWGFFIGYLIPCISMAIATIVFLSGWDRYRKMPPSGSVLGKSVGIIWFSTRSYFLDSTTCGSVVDRASIRNGGKSSQLVSLLFDCSICTIGPFDESDVKATKMLLRIVPFMLCFIPYWSIYSQTSTAFQNQACQMQLTAGNIDIPPAALNLFDSIAILILVPVFDRYLYPTVTRIRGENRPFTMLQKIGWGFFFALLSMIVASIVEQYRLKYSPERAWYEDQAARDNISPCHAIEDYSPGRYQQWEAGTVSLNIIFFGRK